MTSQALSDLKVLEFSRDIAGAYCGRRLADFGAEVIKIEEPVTGNKLRTIGPFPGDIPHPDGSGLFSYLNANKFGITLNPKSAAGKQLFKKLAASADILVEDYNPKEIKNLGLTFNILHRINSKLIITSISPFGQTGPYRDYNATELVSLQMSSLGYDTPPEIKNTAVEQPLKLVGHQATYVAGLSAASATLVAVYQRRYTGKGQQVDISIQEAMTSLAGFGIIMYSYEKAVRPRTGTRLAGIVSLLPCKDGYICAEPLSPDHWQRWVDFLGNPEWAKDPRFKDQPSRKDNWDAVRQYMSEWTGSRYKNDIAEQAQKNRIPVTPVNTVADLVHSDQSKVREFFTCLEASPGCETAMPGPVFKLSETPWSLRRPAPTLGQDNERIFCRDLGLSKEDLVKLGQAGVI